MRKGYAKKTKAPQQDQKVRAEESKRVSVPRVVSRRSKPYCPVFSMGEPMKISLLVILTLIMLAGLILVTTLVDAQKQKTSCEPMRYKPVQDVPKYCLNYFAKEM